MSDRIENKSQTEEHERVSPQNDHGPPDQWLDRGSAVRERAVLVANPAPYRQDEIR